MGKSQRDKVYFAFYIPMELEEEFQRFVDARLSYIRTYGKMYELTPKEKKLIKWLELGQYSEVR